MTQVFFLPDKLDCFLPAKVDFLLQLKFTLKSQYNIRKLAQQMPYSYFRDFFWPRIRFYEHHRLFIPKWESKQKNNFFGIFYNFRLKKIELTQIVINLSILLARTYNELFQVEETMLFPFLAEFSHYL